jgi:uncharacterized protein (DUF1800 family)
MTRNRHPVPAGSQWQGPVTLVAPRPLPLRPTTQSAASIRHLLSRVTYGATPALVGEVKAARTNAAWVEQQLNPSAIDDAACDAVLARWPLATATGPVIEGRVDGGSWDAMQSLVEATIARALWSKRQVFEVMVEFWSNHLNITCPSSEVWSTKPTDDQQVIRAHAFGRFDDMLVASTTSPAMLLFLSNAESQGDDINENYGRELLELHTVGVGAGYTHTDIINAARALSGLSVWNEWNGGTAANRGTLRYRSGWHYVGPLTVLGWTHPNSTKAGGQAVVASLVSYLARRPETARRLATKLALRFVSDAPSSALVDRLAQTYLAADTAIVPVLRQLLTSSEFLTSAGLKQRRPYEDVMATMRALGVAPSPDATKDLGGLAWMLGQIGHAPLGWGLPDGYPDVAAAWTGAGGTLGRWNAHLGLVGGWYSDQALVFQSDLPTHLLGATKPTTRGALMDALLARLVPSATVLPAQRAALITFLRDAGGAPGTDGPLRQGDLDWDFEPLVSLVLNLPQGSAR